MNKNVFGKIFGGYPRIDVDAPGADERVLRSLADRVHPREGAFTDWEAMSALAREVRELRERVERLEAGAE
jgi:hypothetical protein